MKVGIRNLFYAVTLSVALGGSISAQNSRSAIEYGNKLYAQAKYELAIREYRRVGPSDGEVYAHAIYNIGVCSYELWRTDEAITLFKEAIALRHGNYPIASYALGVALEDVKKFPEAKDAYRQSVQTSQGELALPIYRLGVLLANEGDTEAAANHFREASKRRGEHTAASHNNLGVMLARMNRLGEAETEFKIAVRQSTNGFADAEHNLRLCKSLRATTQNLVEIGDRSKLWKLNLPMHSQY
jgi:tetratricopeptide (TPR) repeat protein